MLVGRTRIIELPCIALCRKWHRKDILYNEYRRRALRVIVLMSVTLDQVVRACSDVLLVDGPHEDPIGGFRLEGRH